MDNNNIVALTAGAALSTLTGATISTFDEQLKTTLNNSIQKLSNRLFDSCKEKNYLKRFKRMIF